MEILGKSDTKLPDQTIDVDKLRNWVAVVDEEHDLNPNTWSSGQGDTCPDIRFVKTHNASGPLVELPWCEVVHDGERVREVLNTLWTLEGLTWKIPHTAQTALAFLHHQLFFFTATLVKSRL